MNQTKQNLLWIHILLYKPFLQDIESLSFDSPLAPGNPGNPGIPDSPQGPGSPFNRHQHIQTI